MRLRAYGLDVDCQIALPGVPEDAPSGGRPLRVVAVGEAQLEAAWSGASDPPRRLDRWVDGRPLVIERGRGGDVRMDWAGDGRFHLDAAARVLRAWAPGEPDARWRRVLLDSALGTALLAAGGHGLHGGAVLVDGGVVAVSGPSGAGKTTLVAELVRRGHALVTDDIVAVEPAGEGFLAHPGPPVMNLPPAAAALGEPIAQIDDEAWVAIRGAAREPAPLRAIVLLARGAAPELALAPVADPAVPLLSILLGTGSEPERMARHFALASELAERVPPRRLVAPLAAPPGALADRLLLDLRGPDRD